MGIGAAVGGAVDAAATLGAAGMEINEENKARHLAENYAGQGQADVRAGAAAYNQLLSPYRQLGYKAENNLYNNRIDAAKMPGYQFTLQQGDLATTNSSAARGLASSGAALEAQDRYNTGLANTYYQQDFGDEMGLMNTGLGATGQSGANTFTSDVDQANLGMQAAETGAGAYDAAARSLGSSVGGLTRGIGYMVGGLGGL